MPEVATDRTRLPEDAMFGGLAQFRDPFEGRAAKRRAMRVRAEGAVAMGISIVACGLTAAVWVQALSPLWS